MYAQKNKLTFFLNDTVFAEFLDKFSLSFSKNLVEKKMVCANLHEISRSFLCESSHLRIFVSGVYTKKKELFSWADLFILCQ